MKLNPRQLNIALIFLYLICMLYTAYTLFQLRDDFIYTSQSLSISDLDAARPVIIRLNLVVGFTLLIGLGAMVFLFKNRTDEVIYVEKKKMNKDGYMADDDDNEDESALSTVFINKLLKEEKDKDKLLSKALKQMCNKLEAGVGVIYTVKKEDGKNVLSMKSNYALSLAESQELKYEMGEGLVGQAAKERRDFIIDDVPEGYIKIVSGLGSASPTHLLIQPIENHGELYGVIEIASFTSFGKEEQAFVKSCINKILGNPDQAKETKKTEDSTKKAAKEVKPEAKKESPAAEKAAKEEKPKAKAAKKETKEDKNKKA